MTYSASQQSPPPWVRNTKKGDVILCIMFVNFSLRTTLSIRHQMATGGVSEISMKASLVRLVTAISRGPGSMGRNAVGDNSQC